MNLVADDKGAKMVVVVCGTSRRYEASSKPALPRQRTDEQTERTDGWKTSIALTATT